MKAWLADFIVMGGGWTLIFVIVWGEELAWAAFGGVLFGLTMASLSAWRGWRTIGRRYFADPS